jgi:hypothetical protein
MLRDQLSAISVKEIPVFRSSWIAYRFFSCLPHKISGQLSAIRYQRKGNSWLPFHPGFLINSLFSL